MHAFLLSHTLTHVHTCAGQASTVSCELEYLGRYEFMFPGTKVT